MLLFVAALVRNAWISEDAHITLRTIDNVWHGFGLRWNVLERVQTYTHPLWLLLVGAAYGVTREGAFTTLAISFACTLAVVWLIARTFTPVRACLAFGLMASSRAFVDFSTSGLENPLAHLLLCAFWIEMGTDAAGTARHLVRLTLLASLVGLTRQDLLLLVIPAVLVDAWHVPMRRALPALVVGALPLVAWHAFALIYYGFLFPNTAYAKLAIDLPLATLAVLGLRYLRASFDSDPITLLAIGGGIVAACLHSRRRALTVALPILLYLAYIIRIGGDFMNGRFLTPLFLWAVLTLADARWAARPRVVVALTAASIALAIAMPESALRLWTGPPPFQSRHGVLNEQTSYYEFSGMMPMLSGPGPAGHAWARLGRGMSLFPRVTVHMAVGMFGYYGGPGLHIIDELGLGDPLIARMPAVHFNAPGHYQRIVPSWYQTFLERCVARVYPTAAVGHPIGTCLPYRDELGSLPQTPDDGPAIARYRELLLVTQGPIWDRERLRTIVRLNLTGSTVAMPTSLSSPPAPAP